jgi:hypothetical protein
MLGLFLEWLRNWQLLKKGSAPSVSEWVKVDLFWNLRQKLSSKCQLKYTRIHYITSQTKDIRVNLNMFHDSWFESCGHPNRTNLPLMRSLYALSIYLSIHPCCFHLEHRASVKRFASLQFLHLRHSVGHLGRGISPTQGRYLHKITQTQNKRGQISVPWVGFEATIPAFEQAKTVHALDRAATAIGYAFRVMSENWLLSNFLHRFHYAT